MKYTSTLEVGFELKDAPTAEGIYQGYASIFGVKDFNGDLVESGAFERSLKRKGGQDVKMLWQHGRQSPDPVGYWQELREDDKGLFVKGQLLMELSGAQDRLVLLRSKAINMLSIGFRADPEKQGFNPTDNSRILKEIDLWEISPVTFAANPRAKISQVKQDDSTSFPILFSQEQMNEICGWFYKQHAGRQSDPRTVRELEDFLREAGLSAKKAKALASAGKALLRDVAADERNNETTQLLRDANSLFRAS